ncbi:DNA-processing protein DprA [bacterium]|nr:DNA-processing protein DprA [bacterium]
MAEVSFQGVGIVGARALPSQFSEQVSQVVSYLLQRDYRIHSGGAMGADQFVLESVISLDACSQSVIFSPWVSVSGFPRSVRDSVHRFISYGGQVDWGCVQVGSLRGVVTAGLLARNSRLVSASSGIIAFMHGQSRGTRRTVSEAIRTGRRVIVFLCGDGAELPRSRSGRWICLGGSSPFSGAYLYLPDAHRRGLPYLACDVHQLEVVS